MILRRVLLGGIAVTIVGLAGAWFWLLHTESGAHWLWNFAQQSVGGELRAESIDGDLGNGLMLQGVVFESPGLAAKVASIEIAIDVDVIPLSLELRTLYVAGAYVELTTTDDAADSDPIDLRRMFESLALPIDLVIADLQASDLTIAGLLAEEPIDIALLTMAGTWSDRVEFEQVHLAMTQGSIDANAAIVLRRPFDVTVSSQLRLLPALTGLDKNIEVAASADGDLDSMSVAVDTSGVAASLRGTLSRILDTPYWDLNLEVPAYEHALADGQTVEIRDLALASKGAIDGYDIDLSVGIDSRVSGPLSAKLSGRGTLEELAFSSLEIDGAAARLSATGHTRWAEPQSVKALAVLERLAVTPWLASWPAAAEVSGDVSLFIGEGRLLIHDTALTVAGSEATLGLNANIDLQSNVVMGDVSWSSLQWPMSGTAPQVSSKLGSLLLSGTLDDWTVAGSAHIKAADVAGGQFTVDGRGNRQDLALQITEGDVLGGKLRGQVSYSWLDEQKLAGDLELAHIAIGALLPDWPGEISGGLSVDGQLRPLRLQIELDALNGSLRGGALLANGALMIGAGEMVANELHIDHEQSSLMLDGSLYDAKGLAYEAHVHNLSDYLNDTYGSFEASGQVSLAVDQQYLRIDASSEEVGFSDYRLRGVQINDQGDATQLLDAALSIAELRLHKQIVTDLRLTTRIAAEQQSLAFELSSNGIDLGMGLTGAFDDWSDPSRSPWNGTLDALRLSAANEGSIALQEPAAIIVSTENVEINRFCVGNEAGSNFCADASRRADGKATAHIDLMNIPLALATALTDIELQFSQRIDGTLNWSQDPVLGATGAADVRLSAGTIHDPAGSGATVDTAPGALSFDVRDGKLLAGSLSLPMPGTGDVNGNLTVVDVSHGLQAGIEGSLNISLNDIGIAAAFSPLVDDASGVLHAQFVLEGTAADPLLSGEFRIEDTQLTYLPIGLKLSDLQLNGKLHADQDIELSGHFLAGEGRAEITTRSGYEQTIARGLELELRGENLTVIDVPELRAVVNSNLQLNYDDDTLTLGGDIFVASATIKPHNLTASRVSESPDVQIVAGALPDDTIEQESSSSLRILGELEIGLGDDVLIDLDLAQANIHGQAKFVWSGEPLPVANGRYDLSGEVQAFGQVLNISEGTIRFPNIPANNPTIRLRAEREIYGNSQIKRAGILVAGNAKRQTVVPYTYPLTNEERALTLLVTGSEFDYEKGVGAIDFGTYIAPRLFISYGIGLFDKENVFSARYDLIKGFGVKASSSDKSSGVDLTYRIDR